ncbi:nuclear transport factor 2 family protein [Microbacterium sp. ZW T2_14]|uniref:nuclear transport factor 2 family protein n=1 Tax=Microbacterium sp. ZW T2_14 TaxID=3378079 RepID=UPI003854BCBF
MTETSHSAVDTALDYHRAWTAGDLEAAMSRVAEDVMCHAPAGAMCGVEALRAFMGPFAGSLTGSQVLACYGTDVEALLMYDTSTATIASAPGAELYRVEQGRIVELRIVFDRLPFALARRDVVPAAP